MSAHDLIRDAPFSNLDLISCRNLLIYLNSDLQSRVIPLFHYTLRSNGVLFMGSAEGIGKFSELFSTIDKRNKLFRRRAVTSARPHLPFPITSPIRGFRPGPVPHHTEPAHVGAEFASTLERLLVERYAPACVVINDKLDVLHFQGHTGAYLEAPTGAPDLNVTRMARHGLRMELRRAIQIAREQDEPAIREAKRVRTDRGIETVRISARRLSKFGADSGVLMITFEPAPDAAPSVGARAADTMEAAHVAGDDDSLLILERELEITRESLQATIEEYDAANEEMKNSNEKLAASKEELQSVNEELSTVNAELEAKVEELAQVNSDIRNLLTATQLATVFLSPDLEIRSFTPAATEIFNFIASDIGRPITDVANRLRYSDFASDIEHSLRTLETVEHEVPSIDGRSFLLRVMPYRSTANVIDGVVITLANITGIKAAEAEHRLLATVVRDSNDTVIVQDLDGKITAWNRGAERMYGYSETEALGMNASAISPMEARERMREFIDQMISGDAIPSFETTRICKDGRILDVWLTATALVDDLGQPTAIAVTERDMTNRKRTERRLQQLLEAAPDAMLVVGGDGLIEIANDQAGNLFGHRRSELMGQPLEMLVPEHLRKAHVRHRSDYSAAARARPMRAATDLMAPHKDGTEIPVEISLSPIDGGDGIVTSAAIRDISDRKRAQDALNRAHSELEHRVAERTSSLSEANEKLRNEIAKRQRAEKEILRFADIIASTDDAVIGTGLDGTIVNWNPAAQRIFGYSAAQAIGSPIAMLVPDSMGNDYPERLTDQGHDNEVDHYETFRLREDGTTVDVSLTVSPILDATGELTGASIIGRDIRGQILAARQLAELRRQAAHRERLAELGAVLAKVVHDLGNPLGALALQVQLLARRAASGTLDNEMIKELASKLQVTLSRLEAMVRDLMGFARGQRLQPSDINLAEFLSRVVDLWSQYTSERGIDLSLDLSPDTPILRADRDKLVRVFDNLVKNAVEAIDDATGLVTIGSEVPSPGMVRISVADTGSGIPPDFDVFALFDTTKSGGTGISMPIAQQIIESHGGTITHEQASPHGTIFHVNLPIEGTRAADPDHPSRRR